MRAILFYTCEMSKNNCVCVFVVCSSSNLQCPLAFTCFLITQAARPARRTWSSVRMKTPSKRWQKTKVTWSTDTLSCSWTHHRAADTATVAVDQVRTMARIIDCEPLPPTDCEVITFNYILILLDDDGDVVLVSR